ncbi:MAG: hypothetical protein AAF533_07880 [Acidobacteriota bacterium]
MSSPTSAEPRLGALRYMGNKTNLLGPIRATVERLAPEGSLVVDPMAGSHAVTFALKDRHVLRCSDAQAYSAAVGRAHVDNTSVEQLDPSLVNALREEAERYRRSERLGFMEEGFGDTYLGVAQCRDLDAWRVAVDALLPDETDPRRWLALTSSLTAACRAQASPGHFAQFLDPEHPRTLRLRRIDLLALQVEISETARVRPGLAGSVSRRASWRELVERHADDLSAARLWYLDPPYTRDQYSRFYHFLETLVLGDRPKLEHRARYRDDRFRSAFCSPRTASTELSELFAAISTVSPDSAIVLSYSSRGVLSESDLAAVVNETEALELVDWQRLRHDHSTQGKGVLRDVEEWLVSLRPRRET